MVEPVAHTHVPCSATPLWMVNVPGDANVLLPENVPALAALNTNASNAEMRSNFFMAMLLQLSKLFLHLTKFESDRRHPIGWE